MQSSFMKISMPTPSPLARYHQVLLAVSKRSGGLNLNGLNRDNSVLHTPERAAAGHRHRGLPDGGIWTHAGRHQAFVGHGPWRDAAIFLDKCHSWRANGPVIHEVFPQFAKKPAP